jgi:FkbM family methyltransferase
MIIKFLELTPFGLEIELSIRHYLSYKKQFGNIKFQGEFFQDMIAYIYLQKKKDGFYIDIGANNGISGSNTYIFEQIGWKGICVEPQPDVFLQLKKYRQCDCYEVALSSKSGDNVEFFKSHGANALSRLNEGMSDTHKDWVKEYGKVEYITVKTITFGEMMKKYPDISHIDFMSIDVEGHEMEVLKAIDFSRYSFGFITIEKSKPAEIEEYMGQNGYKLFMEYGADVMFIQNK